MFNRIKALFQNKYPKELKDEWIAVAALGDYWFKKHPGLWFQYKSDSGYISYKVGDLIPLLDQDGKNPVAFYKVLSYKKEGGDLAGWDDGRKYHLRLHSVC